MYKINELLLQELILRNGRVLKCFDNLTIKEVIKITHHIDVFPEVPIWYSVYVAFQMEDLREEIVTTVMYYYLGILIDPWELHGSTTNEFGKDQYDDFIGYINERLEDMIRVKISRLNDS